MSNQISSRWIPLIAATVVVALTFTSIGVLIAARRNSHTPGTAASGSRLASPSPTETPTVLPDSAQLSVPSTNVVWVVVNYDHLYRSTDQGQLWERRPLPASLGVRPSISFIDDQEGWLLAPGSPTRQCETAEASIWHTKDAGSTWEQVATTRLNNAQCKEHIWFFDSKQGLISAWDDNRRPTIYRTGDGGETWSAATLADPPDFKTLPGGFTLRVAWVKKLGNTYYLLAYGRQGAGTPYPDIPDRQYVFTSTNGGETWVWKQKVASPYVVMVTETRWLQLVSPGQSYESTNDGQQFHHYDSDFHTDTPVGGPQIVFADANVGYAEGRGALQRTIDGGAHWTRINTPGKATSPAPSPTPTPIPMPTDAQLSAPSSSVIWALVAGVYLARSTDQGATWQQRTWSRQGGGGNPVISFVDDKNGWALFPGVPATQCSQAAAELWRTSDGAATWTLVSIVKNENNAPNGLPFDQCKEYVAFVDAANGFVAGHDTAHRPVISRTTDGGVTWAQSALPDPPGFVTNGGGNSLRVVNLRSFGGALLAIAQGGAGAEYVFRSGDGGATWSYLAPSTGNAYHPIALVTESRWLLIGNDGSGWETTDTGKSWHQWLCDYQDAAGVSSAFLFADANVGYGTVRGGIQRTTDGGSHWVRLKTPGT